MLVFADIKTTGFSEDDTLCALSLHVKGEQETQAVLLNEGKKISPEASALHHINNQHIAQKKSFADTPQYSFLQSLGEEDVLVVHDYALLAKMFQKYDLQLRCAVIDTKKVAKHLLEDVERFDLLYLLYELRLYKESDTVVYKPLEDVAVIQSLFEYFLPMCNAAKMQELSFKNVLLAKLPFGKYKGRYIEEIVQSDTGYLHWLLSLEDLDEDLAYSVRYYLQGDS